MRRWTKKLQKLSAKLFDLPHDVVYDLPRVTMIGNVQAYIENHSGVLHFSPEQLKLRTGKGEMEIRGKHLVIRSILTEEVFIEGFIEHISISE